MADDNGQNHPRIEKKGGYPGGRPASTVGPPPKTPSGSAGPPPGVKRPK